METHSTVTSNNGVIKIGKTVSSEFPKVKDANVNYRDRLNDVLLTEKHILINYQTAINEIINDDLRGLVVEGRNRIQNIHTAFFNELFNLGEYQADAAGKTQIRDIQEVFGNYRVQLPYRQ